jgi:hypothetical protein
MKTGHEWKIHFCRCTIPLPSLFPDRLVFHGTFNSDFSW